MKITIGIPVYNGVEWLPEAIESALAQKGNIEVIVCDDGSTDGSLEIAKSYESKYFNFQSAFPGALGGIADFPIKVISQVNKGLASARNTIIMNMTGDYLLPLDADDILLDTCIEKIIEKIQETGDDIIAPSFKTFGTSGQEVILMENPTIEDFKTANRIGYCSAIKREALLEVGGYNPKMTWGAEDYDLWHDLLKRGKTLVTIPEVLWLYRTKENSMWTETQKHSEEFMEQIKKNHPEIYG
jgi:glycosyltransferase involved in cell wall biosynthesis